MRDVLTTVPEFNEEMPVVIVVNNNWDKDTYKPKNLCRHVRDGVLPRAIWARNEGGYNSTLVCLDCLLEWLISHRDEVLTHELPGSE